jgi:hypothetical protein
MSVEMLEVDEVGTIIDVTEVDAVVANGMKLLDEKFGTNFHEQIDPDKLDIGSGVNCICGQLYGSYCNGVEKLELSSDQAEEHGFYRRTGYYDKLNVAWKRALAERVSRLAESA